MTTASATLLAVATPSRLPGNARATESLRLPLTLPSPSSAGWTSGAEGSVGGTDEYRTFLRAGVADARAGIRSGMSPVDCEPSPCQPSGRDTFALGIWIPEPDLQPQEAVLATFDANRTQGRRAVGGRLFLTTTHLRFLTHRFDRMLGGRDWAIPRHDISSASVADRSGVGDAFAGGIRRRLQVDAQGSVELFA